MASYFPTRNFLIPDNQGFAQLLSQNFLGMKLDSENIQNGAITSTQLAQLVPDSDPRIVYSANWSVETASSSAPAGYVGGYQNKYHSSNTANEFLQYSDVVKGFYVYCIVGPDCGQINISVDSASPTLIDLYSSTYGVSLVYSTNLQTQQHTIRITLAGSKNSSSTGYRCNFVGISEGQLVSDLNILPGGLNDISVNSVNGNKIQANTTLFNVALSNGNGTFTVDSNGNITCNNAAIDGSLTVNGTFTFPLGSIGLSFLGAPVSGYPSTYANSAIFTNTPYNSLILQSGISDFGSPFSYLTIGGTDTSNGLFREMATFILDTTTPSIPKTSFQISSYNTTTFQVDELGNTTMNSLILNTPTTQTTSPSSGGAGALPANPAGYLLVPINGTNRYIPYY